MTNICKRPVTPKHEKKRKKKESDRSKWEAIRALGCIICGSNNAHLHHAFTGAGGRKDDSKVIGLCYEHHQGSAGIHFLGRKKWQAIYGSEQDLLDKIQQLIK